MLGKSRLLLWLLYLIKMHLGNHSALLFQRQSRQTILLLKENFPSILEYVQLFKWKGREKHRVSSSDHMIRATPAILFNSYKSVLV